ncbi:MAG: helix-turn-helix transcriptional regulator [Planctomycetes bacterium]|nr:helix-turn-helix transcriptional regulator [Planctomycetota bacterium]
MDFKALSEAQILLELGRRFRRERLNQNVSQIELAHRAGLSRTAIRNVESGSDCTLTTMIRVLRALGVLDQLDAFMPDPGISPIQLSRLHGRIRQRASGGHGESRKD